MAMIFIVDCFECGKKVRRQRGEEENLGEILADERSPKITLVASGSQFSRDIEWQFWLTRSNCARGRGLRLHTCRALFFYSVDKRSRETDVGATARLILFFIKAVLPD